MRLEDFQSHELEDFGGHYERGEVDEVPLDHFSDTLNIDYDNGLARTRDGLSNALSLTPTRIRRFFLVSLQDTLKLLILDNTGALYVDDAGAPLITVATATDFSAINFFDKVYIAFHDGQQGLTGVNLKVYVPSTGEFRDAAGAALTAASAMIAADGAAGLVPAGIHKYAVVGETSTGHLVPPGPLVAGVFTPTSFNSAGSKKVDLSVVPTGPSYIVKRHIIATRVGGEEYFFVPNGVINDNVTTIITINFLDEDLVESADRLFDILTTIPAPLGLFEYRGRLGTFAEFANPSMMRLSNPGEPEAFDSVDGIVIVTRDDGYRIRNIIKERDTLYILKTLGAHATEDNGRIPAEWDVSPVDLSINGCIHGVSELIASKTIHSAQDRSLVVDRSGIVLFDGVFRKKPITWKIDKIWQRLNYAQYHKTVLVNDSHNHKIYCALPLNASTDNDTLLLGDYSDCDGNVPNANQIKWAVWHFHKNPTAIGMVNHAAVTAVVDSVPHLVVMSVDINSNKIYVLNPDATTDDSTAIESYFETSLVYFDSGSIHFFVATQVRVIGSGTLLITIRGLDDYTDPEAAIQSITLAASATREYLVEFTFTNEKARLKYRLTSGFFTISKIEIFGKVTYTMRPAAL